MTFLTTLGAIWLFTSIFFMLYCIGRDIYQFVKKQNKRLEKAKRMMYPFNISNYMEGELPPTFHPTIEKRIREVEELVTAKAKIQAREKEIEELKADIQSRYEYEKEIHEWTKTQQQDFANLRDVAVKLEQENERLRGKLGMDSLAPSANHHDDSKEQVVSLSQLKGKVKGRSVIL